MTANHETSHNAIRSRFKTEVVDKISGGLSTQYDNNDEFTVPTDTRWCRFAVLDGDSFQTSLGSTKNYRTAGIAVAEIRIPVGRGDKEALVVADFIKDAFTSVSVSGVTFKTPKVETIGRAGAWWQVNVTCPFQVDRLI